MIAHQHSVTFSAVTSQGKEDGQSQSMSQQQVAGCLLVQAPIAAALCQCLAQRWVVSHW